MKKNKKDFMNKKSTEERNINNPNEINTSVEIPMYYPNLGLMPKEYQISPQLAELEKTFKEQCESFLSKSNPDEFNSSYMDAVIERICVDAIRFVKVQRADHEALIMKVLDAMHNGDYSEAKDKLQYYLNDREKYSRELEMYRRVYWSGTSLAEEV